LSKKSAAFWVYACHMTFRAAEANKEPLGERGKIDQQGFDAGKKVTVRKRHILVDTLGLLHGVSVWPANIQDRDGARDLLWRARRRFPFIERNFADAGLPGSKMARTIAATEAWKTEIVKRLDRYRFVVLAKRWMVEPTFAWISPKSSSCARFRSLCVNRRRILTACHDPSHAPTLGKAKPLFRKLSFLDRL
jgi:transposase